MGFLEVVGRVKSRVVIPALLGLLALTEEGIYWLQNAKKGREANKFFWGNFRPVDGDLFQAGLPIQGTLPPEVAGVFLRNGPNPVHIAGDLHWFDGDGMVHAVKLDPVHQTANYSANLVQTSRVKQELQAGRALFYKFGDMKGPSAVALMLLEGVRNRLGLLDKSQGIGTGNTALAFHGGNLLALHEGDQPHALRVEDEGRVTTIGRIFRGGKSPNDWFTAHPKIDPVTQEMHAFGYHLEHQPYATYYHLNKDGAQVTTRDLEFTRPVMTHDMALTQNYAIWFEASLYLAPEDLFKGKEAFRFDEGKPTRFCVLPLRGDKDASKRALQWFELPPSYIFHTGNAWEEEDDQGGVVIRLYAMRYEHFDLSFRGTIEKNDAITNTFTKEELDQRTTHLWEYQLNLRTGEAKQRRLSFDTRAYEFPQVRPSLLGRRSRFIYASVFTPQGQSEGFIKIDLEPSWVGPASLPHIQEVKFGERTFGGEVVFVPREEGEGEDDGYLLTLTYTYPEGEGSEDEGRSEFRVYDARTMEAVPYASVSLPRRVPYGFHALFVPQHELDHQREVPTSINPTTTPPPPPASAGTSEEDFKADLL